MTHYPRLQACGISVPSTKTAAIWGDSDVDTDRNVYIGRGATLGALGLGAVGAVLGGRRYYNNRLSQAHEALKAGMTARSKAIDTISDSIRTNTAIDFPIVPGVEDPRKAGFTIQVPSNPDHDFIEDFLRSSRLEHGSDYKQLYGGQDFGSRIDARDYISRNSDLADILAKNKGSYKNPFQEGKMVGSNSMINPETLAEYDKGLGQMVGGVGGAVLGTAGGAGLGAAYYYNQ